jgi:tight junction protein 1
MTSRLSYASSPESDLDLSPEPRCAVPPGSTAPPPGPGPGPPRLVKSSSDPSIATQEDGGVPSYSAPPPYSSSNHYKQVSVYSVIEERTQKLINFNVPFHFLAYLEKIFLSNDKFRV